MLRTIKKLKVFRTNAVSVLMTMLMLILTTGCSKQEDYGTGPVKEEIKLTGVDRDLFLKGERIFRSKCSVCHKFNSGNLAPSLADVTKRRRPEWIMNQILNPVQMVQKDKIASELSMQYRMQMPQQDISIEDARALLEYLRAVDAGDMTAE